MDGVEVLVNAAGIGSTTDAPGTPLEVWEDVFAVNARGTFLCCKHAIPGMKARGSGAIVNVASVAGLIGLKNRVAYSASKGAVIALTRALAVDHVGDGIRVNAVCPGTIDTPWVRRLVDDAGESLDALRARQLMGRLGTPEEVADAVLYLATADVRDRHDPHHRRRPDRSVKALVVEPGVAHSTRIEDVDEPAGDGVLLRVLEVGVCGTDREIAEGQFGVAPQGGEQLVLGHESLAAGRARRPRLLEGRPRLRDRPPLVRPLSRLRRGRARLMPDGRLQRARDHAARRVRVRARARGSGTPRPDPARLGRLGVLAEPTSICTRGIRHALTIGARQPWEPERALVTGAGAVGLLSTMLLRLEGLDVWTASLEPASAIAEALGAHYVSTRATDLAELGPFDIVVEAAGDAQLLLDASACCGRSGVACLLGIDGRERKVADRRAR